MDSFRSGKTGGRPLYADRTLEGSGISDLSEVQTIGIDRGGMQGVSPTNADAPASPANANSQSSPPVPRRAKQARAAVTLEDLVEEQNKLFEVTQLQKEKLDKNDEAIAKLK